MPSRPGAEPRTFEPGTYHNPAPVPWSAERAARGASTTPGPRCPAHGCPVRWAAGGPDRLCPEHAPPAGAGPLRLARWQRDTLAYMLRRRRQKMTAAQKVTVLELLRDHRRSNRAIATVAGVDHVTVRRTRHDLEDAGLIPVYRATPGQYDRTPPRMASSPVSRSLNQSRML